MKVLPPADAEYLENRNLSIEEVARIFAVDPIEIPRKSAESREDIYLRECLLPFLQKLAK